VPTPPPFRAIADLIHEHALARPRSPALSDAASALDYGALDALMDRTAAALRRDGLIRPDELGLGVDSDEDGRLIAADGRASRRLSLVGPLRKGRLWENTAVPELRVEARRMAERLASGAAIAPVRVGCEPPALKKGQPWYALPDRRLERLPLDHPLYHCHYDIKQVEYTPRVREDMGLTNVELMIPFVRTRWETVRALKQVALF